MANGNDINPEKTKVSLSLIQFGAIMAAIVSGTLVVSGFANGLKEEVAQLRSQLQWVMTDKRMNDWVWEANRANPTLHLPDVRNAATEAEEQRDEQKTNE